MQIELEIKCLLGNQERMDAFLQLLNQYADKMDFSLVAERQLNHYFTGGTILDLHNKLSSRMLMQDAESLFHLCLRGRNHKVSTRSILPGDSTFLVMRCPSSTDTSTQGDVVVERQSQFVSTTLDELDAKLLDMGWEYQPTKTKISTRYRMRGVNVLVEYDAECGYVAEFETIIMLGEDVHDAEDRIIQCMEYFGMSQITQDALQQLFPDVDRYRLEAIFGLSETNTIAYQFGDLL